ncbi:MAG: DUF697 domain-containing protein [Kiritimatiellae bacterium]|nr:DUF697 domain-containing protein [Kiritimatiellia bacterium]
MRQGENDITPPLAPPDVISSREFGSSPSSSAPAAPAAPNGTTHVPDYGTGLVPFLGWLLVLVVTLWMFSLSAPFLANAIALKGWRAWASLAAGLVPFLAVTAILVYAFTCLSRIPKVESFSAGLPPLVLRQSLEMRYLVNFPEAEKFADANGFTNEARGEIVRTLESLRGRAPHARHADAAGWLGEFRTFLAALSTRADAIIADTCKAVAIKTAICPWRIIDMLAVCYNSTLMVVRIARLYNRRCSRRAAFRLVARWIANIYISGEIGSFMEDASAAGSDAAVAWIGEGDAAEYLSAAMPVLSKFIGKAAEGGANAYLAYRLGRRAVAYFAPVHSRKTF